MKSLPSTVIQGIKKSIKKSGVIQSVDDWVLTTALQRLRAEKIGNYR